MHTILWQWTPPRSTSESAHSLKDQSPKLLSEKITGVGQQSPPERAPPSLMRTVGLIFCDCYPENLRRGRPRRRCSAILDGMRTSIC